MVRILIYKDYMEKIIRFAPETLFVSFCAKALFISPTLSEVAICAILGISIYISKYLKSKDTVKNYEKNLEETNKKFEEYKDTVNSLRNSLDSVRMSIGLKNVK